MDMLSAGIVGAKTRNNRNKNGFCPIMKNESAPM